MRFYYGRSPRCCNSWERMLQRVFFLCFTPYKVWYSHKLCFPHFCSWGLEASHSGITSLRATWTSLLQPATAATIILCGEICYKLNGLCIQNWNQVTPSALRLQTRTRTVIMAAFQDAGAGACPTDVRLVQRQLSTQLCYSIVTKYFAIKTLATERSSNYVLSEGVCSRSLWNTDCWWQ